MVPISKSSIFLLAIFKYMLHSLLLLTFLQNQVNIRCQNYFMTLACLITFPFQSICIDKQRNFTLVPLLTYSINRHQREDIEYWITLHYSTPAEQEVPKVSLVYKENNSFQVHIIAETIEKFIFSLTYGPHKPTIYLCDTNIVKNIENAFDFKFEKVTQNANDDAQLAKEKYVGRHLFWRNSRKFFLLRFFVVENLTNGMAQRGRKVYSCCQ